MWKKVSICMLLRSMWVATWSRAGTLFSTGLEIPTQDCVSRSELKCSLRKRKSLKHAVFNDIRDIHWSSLYKSQVTLNLCRNCELSELNGFQSEAFFRYGINPALRYLVLFLPYSFKLDFMTLGLSQKTLNRHIVSLLHPTKYRWAL